MSCLLPPHLHLSPSFPQVSLSPTDTQTMVRVLRRLVAAVTRILLVADDTVVKQLLRATEPPDPTAGICTRYKLK